MINLVTQRTLLRPDVPAKQDRIGADKPVSCQALTFESSRNVDETYHWCQCRAETTWRAMRHAKLLPRLPLEVFCAGASDLVSCELFDSMSRTWSCPPDDEELFYCLRPPLPLKRNLSSFDVNEASLYAVNRIGEAGRQNKVVKKSLTIFDGEFLHGKTKGNLLINRNQRIMK